MNSRDKIEQHLIKQKARALDIDGSACMYRGKDGLMCAAGCLIPDELYSPKFERRAINLLVVDGHRSVFPDDISVEELKMWQSYHDGVVSLDPDHKVFWGYQRWIDGKEEHHPSLFKQALNEALEAKNAWEVAA